MQNKRYNTFSSYLKEKFGGKIAKISLNAGLSCPNIDGTKGTGGCTYCSSLGSGDFAGDARLSLKEQFESIKSIMDNKWDNIGYIAYFQANTNTYAPINKLKEMYETVLSFDDVVGISIATRPDCISPAIADYLEELSANTFLTVELGLQTIYDETGERINRCHNYDDFLKGYNLLNDRGINICVHIINGLPGETKDMMINTAKTIAKLNLHSIKIHLLHILKNTKIADEYFAGEFEIMSQADYVSIVCSQLEYFSPTVVVQRLTGDGKLSELIAPMWSTKKLVTMNEIDKEFKRRNTYQGIYALTSK